MTNILSPCVLLSPFLSQFAGKRTSSWADMENTSTMVASFEETNLFPILSSNKMTVVYLWLNIFDVRIRPVVQVLFVDI